MLGQVLAQVNVAQLPAAALTRIAQRPRQHLSASFLGKLGAGFGVGGMQRVILAYMGRARRTCATPLPTGHRRRSRKDGGNCQSSSGLVQCYPEVACNVAVYGLAEQRRLHAPFRRGSSRECDVFASM